jgi:anaerobic selenocysteine-containing dehydrogenase
LESEGDRNAGRRSVSSICRSCNCHCPITVELEGDVPKRVIGNRRSPLYRGFCCSRGQAIPEQFASSERLLCPLKRNQAGEYAIIGRDQLFEEITASVKRLLDKHGPDSIACYQGTYSLMNPATNPMSLAFFQSIGSPMIFNTVTIDQPGKNIAGALLGGWEAGLQGFPGANVWLIIGANPLVSLGITVPPQNPARQLTEALGRGMKLLVIDPRRTETARRAEVHIQSRPGQDAAIIAAMLNVILREGLHDESFVREHVSGKESLARAVAKFTPEMAAARADVPSSQIEEAARIFAKARRGIAIGSTGANMSGLSTLTEYLILCLNTVCGRYRREGETLDNPGVLLSRAVPRAQARAPQAAVFPDISLRSRDLCMSVVGMPTAALADEILCGRIKALFVLGGNPVAAMPGQNRTIEALGKLELFVQHDVRMSASAKLAHYVVPPPITLETPTTSLSVEMLEQVNQTWGFPAPFGMYAPAAINRPAGSELIEEWELFYEMAQNLGLKLALQPMNETMNGSHRTTRPPMAIDMERKPTTDDLISMICAGSRVPLEEVKRYSDGALFPEDIRVAPGDLHCRAKMDVANVDMMEQLSKLAGEPGSKHQVLYPFQLIGRRVSHVYNSAFRDLPSLVRKGGGPGNPAFVHPDDLAALGLESGDAGVIVSPNGSIQAIFEADETLRQGVVAMSHSFGDIPGSDSDFRLVGSNTSLLTSVQDDYDRYSGIPRMSAVPVRLERAAPGSV